MAKIKRWKVRASHRRQTRNLNVYSPAPEVSINVYSRAAAKLKKKEYKKKYKKVSVGYAEFDWL